MNDFAYRRCRSEGTGFQITAVDRLMALIDLRIHFMSRGVLYDTLGLPTIPAGDELNILRRPQTVFTSVYNIFEINWLLYNTFFKMQTTSSYMCFTLLMTSYIRDSFNMIPDLRESMF